MGPGLWAAVLALGLVLEAAWAQPIFPSITNRPFIRECVRVHNEFRRRVVPAASNMRQMTWDAALARTARAWAKKCVFKSNTYLSKRYQCHPTFESVGENIWIGSYQIFDVQIAVNAWYKHNIFYNFSLHTCIKDCGRYTQVVWDNSYKLGCAVVFCEEVGGVRNAANFICNYGPAFIGANSQGLDILLVLRGPKLSTVLEVWPHQSWVHVHGDDHFPDPAGYTIADTSQDAVGLLGYLGTLLAQVQSNSEMEERFYKIIAVDLAQLNCTVGKAPEQQICIVS
ncbi:GLIPR1-like protein 1 [Mergus octosetaceus]